MQSRIANDVGGVDNVITNTASGTVQNVIAAVAVAALIMAWKLALICLVVVPLLLVLALRLGRQRRTIARAVAFTSMLNRLVGPATARQGIGMAASTSMALFGRIFEVLELPIDLREKADARSSPAVRG